MSKPGQRKPREPIPKRNGEEGLAGKSRGPFPLLRHGTLHLIEHIVGVAADQTDSADHNHENHGEHHRVFGDILPAIISPPLTDSCDHCIAPI